MRSLRARLIVWLVVGITLVLATSGVAIHAIVSSRLRSDFDRNLLTTARSLAPVLRREIAFSTVHGSNGAPPRPSFATERADILFEMRYPDGEVVLRSDRFAGEELPRLARDAEPIGFAPDRPEDLRYSDIVLPPDGHPGRALAFVLGPPPRPGILDRMLDPDRPGSGHRLRDRLPEGQRDRRGWPPEDPEGNRPHRGGAERPGRDGIGPDRHGPDRPGAERFEVVLAGDTTELLGSLRRLRELLVLAWLACSLGCAAILSWVVHNSLRPLGRLSNQIGKFTSDGLQTRFVLPKAPAELEPVVAELNLLLDRMQSAFDREQAFTADAAHELRTPLAGLRSTLEVALTRERSGAEYRHFAQASLAITEDMQALVADLMTLSRMGSDEVGARCEDTPLAELFADAQAAFIEPAEERGLTLDVEFDDACVVSTDAVLLRRVLRNLIENAVTYADHGSSIVCRGRLAGHRVVLELSNLAAEAPADLAEKAFLAFWRGDASRSMTNNHAGLGLALCQRIVQQVGGSIDAEFSDGRFYVRLSLPRASS